MLDMGFQLNWVLPSCAEDPLFSFLKAKQGGVLTKDIKWNFTKFLVDREGNVVKRCAYVWWTRMTTLTLLPSLETIYLFLHHYYWQLNLHLGAPQYFEDTLKTLHRLRN